MSTPAGSVSVGDTAANSSNALAAITETIQHVVDAVSLSHQQRTDKRPKTTHFPPAPSKSTASTTTPVVIDHSLSKQQRIQRLADEQALTLQRYQPPFGADGPDLRLAIHSLQSKQNFGQLLRSAVAHAIQMVYVIDRHETKKAKFSTFGNHGTVKHITFIYFRTLESLKQHLVQSGFQLVGIEIDEQRSVSVVSAEMQQRWRRKVCLLAGNEALGMSPEQKAICDELVYIPQFSAYTASLNVVVASSIVMHHFAVWAQFPEASNSNGKYQNPALQSTDDQSTDVATDER